ncbi:MAG: hypothetical protein M9930_05015, partial [Anaerolineae bacterium]|nr:hypothetical protein [Anaerolineae bacterium]
RSIIHRMASHAYEIDLDVMTGSLHCDEDGRWFIGQHDLIAWLDQHTGEEVTFILGSSADERDVQTRTCRTCGRDYVDIECPHCRSNRIRLRGR